MYCKKCGLITGKLAFKLKYYYAKNVEEYYHLTCLNVHLQQIFTQIILSYIEDKRIDEHRFTDILKIIEDLPILPYVESKPELSIEYLHIVSMFILQHFLEPKYIRIVDCTSNKPNSPKKYKFDIENENENETQSKKLRGKIHSILCRLNYILIDKWNNL